MIQSICKAAGHIAGELTFAKRTGINYQLKERYDGFDKANPVADKHQPAQLIEAPRCYSVRH